jgi:hypothetical protein
MLSTSKKEIFGRLEQRLDRYDDVLRQSKKLKLTDNDDDDIDFIEDAEEETIP